MANNREEILKVENLKHYFISGRGKNRIVVKAVDDISFSIFKGEVFSLVGESGCGKSITALSITQLNETPPLNYDGGRIDFEKKTQVRSDLPLDFMGSARIQFVS